MKYLWRAGVTQFFSHICKFFNFSASETKTHYVVHQFSQKITDFRSVWDEKIRIPGQDGVSLPISFLCNNGSFKKFWMRTVRSNFHRKSNFWIKYEFGASMFISAENLGSENRSHDSNSPPSSHPYPRRSQSRDQRYYFPRRSPNPNGLSCTIR